MASQLGHTNEVLLILTKEIKEKALFDLKDLHGKTIMQNIEVTGTEKRFPVNISTGVYFITSKNNAIAPIKFLYRQF